MIRVALRPKWVLFFIFVMGVAALFAFLGKWQLETALQNAAQEDYQTETVVPLAELLEPTATIATSSGGHMTEVSGAWAPESFTQLTGRLNFGESGYWLVGRLITSGDGESTVSIPVAIGWAADSDSIESAEESLNAQALAGEPITIIGRLMPPEAPEAPEHGEDPFTERTLSVASLVNTWPDYQGSVYLAYVISDEPLATSLEAIQSEPPQDVQSINWLNIFYAIEWVVFAGFAFYIWFRMVRDEWEADEEERLQALSQASANDSSAEVN